MVNGVCEVCGKTGYVEIHHNIKRSQASYMKQIKINLVQLCQDHHRGSTNGVHHNKKLDLKLKIELQNKLQAMFTEKYYSREEIQEKLECSDFDVTLIVKKIALYRYGYNTEQLIRRMLGGRLYD